MKSTNHKVAASHIRRFMRSATWGRAQERFLTLTPDERWALNVDFWKSRRLWTIEERRKAGWDETHQEQKDSVQAILIQKDFVKYLAARHGFEP
jgi:hypothetical protein